MALEIKLETSVDRLPATSVDPPGVLVLRHHNVDGEFWSEVRKADAHLSFTWQLLENVLNRFEPNINDGTIYPEMRLEPPPDFTEDKPWCRYHHHNSDEPGAWADCNPPRRCMRNWLLHIDGRNQHVVYRIGEYDPKMERWAARWPD